MNNVGEKIRRFRSEKRLTGKDMAEKLGISQNAYHKKETGESSISVTELLKLSQILEKPIEELLKEELSVFNIQYNTDGRQPQIGHYVKTDSPYERKLWEELLIAKDIL